MFIFSDGLIGEAPIHMCIFSNGLVGEAPRWGAPPAVRVPVALFVCDECAPA